MGNFATNSPNPAGGQLGRKAPRYKKNRRAIYASQPAKPPYVVPTLTGVGSGAGSGVGPGSVLTVDFDHQVSVNTSPGSTLPNWTDVSQSPNLVVVAVQQISPTRVLLTFNGSIAAGDTIKIADIDPPIRSFLGGFVQPGDYLAP